LSCAVADTVSSIRAALQQSRVFMAVLRFCWKQRPQAPAVPDPVQVTLEVTDGVLSPALAKLSRGPSFQSLGR